MEKEIIKIKCKECGKEINKKAEICPHCGCRVKSNLLKYIIINVIVIITIILVFLVFTKTKTELGDDNQKNVKSQYVGTWKLQEQKDVYKKDTKIFLDDYLTFTEENIRHCLGCDRYCESNYNQKLTKICDNVKPTVHLAEKENEIAIDFVGEDGYSTLLCFRLIDEFTLNQISCEGVALDEGNPNGFYVNGGIGEELGIIYKKQ